VPEFLTSDDLVRLTSMGDLWPISASTFQTSSCVKWAGCQIVSPGPNLAAQWAKYIRHSHCWFM